MQLSSLEIYGFKSFADRTRFVFDEGVTGVVGPNGCGKSNIVDAVRWVLGEQRTRNLRSDKMENVIFNGTKSRRKSNFAEVSLTFENTRNILPTEYSTVTITRKLYRSGESEYMLNGVVCRLKDISNLFMDTGISPDSYAIIELKMVDEILTNANHERRRFFEEAAGISKYKIRKKQTLRRLEETDDNLERVEDLLFEIEKNLKSLEKQARRTQRYIELKKEYKIASSRFAYLKMKQIRTRLESFDKDEQSLKDAESAVTSKMAQLEARLQDLRKTVVDQERELSQAQQDLNQHVRHIQTVENQKSVKNERLKYLQQREIAIQDQLNQEQRQMQQDEVAVEHLKGEREKASVAQKGQQELEEKLKATLDLARKENDVLTLEVKEKETAFRNHEQELSSQTREQEIKRVQVQSLKAELQRTEEDRNRREFDLDAFTQKSDELESDATRLEKELDKLNRQKDSVEKELRETETESSELKDRVYKTNRVLDAKQNEYNLTKSLVENLEGFPESVKFLRKNAKWIKDAPLVSDVFGCPEPFKIAFENFLEPYLSYYVVPRREDAILAVHMLADSAKGRANFFILDELSAFKQINQLIFTQATPALEIVEFADGYKDLAAFLLDGVYVVGDEADIPDEVPPGITFLVKAGNVSRRRFMLSGGSLGLFEGKRLGRAQNLKKLEKEIHKLQKELTAEKVLLDQAVSKLEKLKKIDLRKEIEPRTRALVERQRDLSVLKSREKEHQSFMERVGKRTETLGTELGSLETALLEIEPKIAAAKLAVEESSAALEAARIAAREKSDILQNAAEEYNKEHIRLIHTINTFNNLVREITEKEEKIKSLHANRERLKLEFSTVSQDMEKLVMSNHQDDEQIVALYEEKKSREGRTGVLEQKLAQTKSSIYQVEESLNVERRKREELGQRRNELKDQATEVRIEANSLKERMSVEFQVELDNLERDALFDKEPDPQDADRLEEDVFKIRNRIQNFGEINPMAVEAYEEMKERFDFITGQKADLIEAKTSLLETIAEIDEQARTQFLETFDIVRSNFQRVFRNLFSEDDTCDLILLNGDDPLESDIDIVARPKGKRPLTIRQLSGGEKTLTAVALLFSIYLFKPAPFCIFDEVDAPLDDANIDKFNNIVREFSNESQFIVVTHNKRTMAATNVMYGVTMQDAGVSKVLPVDLEALKL
jgi:chromosome segregation protein